MPELARATKARIEAKVEARGFVCTNAWDFWLFPRRTERRPEPPAGTRLVAWGSAEETEALASGENVVSLANQTGEPNYAVGEGAEACYCYLAARTLPNGARHVVIAGLDVTGDTPVGSALLRGVYAWLANP